ncbi:hypothetical protein [Nitrincola alkalilacustris]|uniref:hypothetical protein n=1 Tax=Nitrincola alkalilacustris TaxID=1571224 RepID=UPI00124ED2B1|nr:hypothetical protein [Nitrincola alkalilacustris]
MKKSLLNTTLLLTSIAAYSASTGILASDHEADCHIAYAKMEMDSQANTEDQNEPQQPKLTNYLIEVNSDGTIPSAVTEKPRFFM